LRRKAAFREDAIGDVTLAWENGPGEIAQGKCAPTFDAKRPVTEDVL